MTSHANSCPACGQAHAGNLSVRGLCPHCLLSLALVDSERDESPTLLREDEPSLDGEILGNRYQVRSLLGRGGMGEVWRAFDLKLRVDVALKAVRADFLAKEQAEEFLRREVRSAREVVSPNVCRVFDLVVEDGRELVSMEYIDGTTLSEIVRTRGPLELQEARELASQFLSGLEAIHQAGLVHRDFKPDNVMVTRSGRVVVMDFGIAKGLADAKGGTIAGTPAYMAPEQARGASVDARADVFSAGVVLAEMIACERGKPPRAFLEALREVPPNVPEGPWAPVLRQALAWEPEARYDSAHSLARALEEVHLELSGFEDLRPYPGLAAFTEADTEFFFGRELEVEALWKKLKRPHVMALIGASGAGKSSFLRAGLLPTLPERWGVVVCAPGSRPFQALAQTLVPFFAGDEEAMRRLMQFEDAEVVVSLMSRWRARWENALIVVDQFEELFTQNPAEVQKAFATLLARLVLEADVHVLLSLRDDFLVHCQSHEALSPIFSDLTPLGTLSESSLRRALVQPALTCGYRFEDEALVDEMIAEVGDERGALPLLAFAASRLWEKRDRQKGLLTRDAYESIGRVSGALAHHADATLDRIGAAKVPIVRELFRNLVTAQGTRVGRKVEELLSLFADGEERESANEVLRTLIDARLLTTYESVEGRDAADRRVEIIHESLLSRWPRLVRWQTQDEEGAQLRDELRQAAQMWEHRNRSDDLLWTGTAFRELELWRERYPGRLTETEESFAEAMVERSQRQRRRRRRAVASVMGVLVVGLAAIATLWFRAEVARARGAASELFALGQLEEDDHPTAALAYALASLERADTAEVRRFALETLWRGPTAFVVGSNEGMSPGSVIFSPDGNWLLQRSASGSSRLWSADGAEPRWLVEEGVSPRGEFSSDSKWIVTKNQTTRFWSLPEAKEVWHGELDYLWARTFGQHLIGWSVLEDQGDGVHRRLLRGWPLGGGEPETFAVYAFREDVIPPRGFGVDTKRQTLITWAHGVLYELPIRAELASPRQILQDADPVKNFATAEKDLGVTEHLVTAHASGRIQVWSRSRENDGFAAMRAFYGSPQRPSTSLDLDASGEWLAAGKGDEKTVELWNLGAPPDVNPLVLRRGDVTRVINARFHPRAGWLSVVDVDALTLWPVTRDYPRVLHAAGEHFRNLVFDPRGEWLAACTTRPDGSGALWLWPLTSTGERGGILLEDECGLLGLDVSPNGDLLAVSSRCGRIYLVPPSGAPVRELTGVKEVSAGIARVAFDREGRRLAAGADGGVVRIFDLGTGEGQTLDQGHRAFTASLDFMREGRLLAGSYGRGLRLWNLESGTGELLLEGNVVSQPSPDGRLVALTLGKMRQNPSGEAYIFDLETSTLEALPAYGDEVVELAWDPSGTHLVTASQDGTVRFGPVDGGEPHLLLGHEDDVWKVAVDPTGEWIASASADGTVRLWPTPRGEPLHTLPYEELMKRLSSLTNYRVVEDDDARNGFSLAFEYFPGWDREPPTW